jgi:hypothetical protein
MTGSFGGLNGADAICQDRADDHGNALPGTYKAWLSTGVGEDKSPAKGRFRRSAKPYVLRNNTQIAANWDDLTSCESGVCLDSPIFVAEDGTTVPLSDETEAWSATNTEGNFLGGDNTCSGWQTASGLGGFGYTSNPAGPPWTTGGGGALPCSFGARLYCFQQA